MLPIDVLYKYLNKIYPLSMNNNRPSNNQPKESNSIFLSSKNKYAFEIPDKYRSIKRTNEYQHTTDQQISKEKMSAGNDFLEANKSKEGVQGETRPGS